MDHSHEDCTAHVTDNEMSGTHHIFSKLNFERSLIDEISLDGCQYVLFFYNAMLLDAKKRHPDNGCVMESAHNNAV